MKSTITFLFIALFSLQVTHAQNEYENGNNDNEETLFGDGAIKLSGVWGGSSLSFLNLSGDGDFSSGGYFVFEFNDDYLLGWSGYGSDGIILNNTRATIEGSDLILGYAYNSNKTVHPVAYFKAGVAELDVDFEPIDDILVVEPRLGVEANITRWFRLSLEGGYRWVSHVDLENFSNEDFSAPFIGLRLKFGWSWK